MATRNMCDHITHRTKSYEMRTREHCEPYEL